MKSCCRWLVWLCAVVVFACPGLSHAVQIIYVNKNAPATSQNNGTSWANAYFELRSAIIAATPTDSNKTEIWVAKGTYMPAAASDTNRFASFALKSHLRILGGFSGFETAETQRPPTGNYTVLSGDIGETQSGAVTDASTVLSVPLNQDAPGFQDNCYNVITCIDAEDIILERLIITGGNATLTEGDNSLTLLDVESMIQPKLGSTNPAVLDPTYTGGTYTNKGEALALPDRRVIGAGLYFKNPYERSLTQQNLLITQCHFVANYASGYGGAMGGTEGLSQVVYTTFENNASEFEGGAFWGLNQHTDFIECEFRSNASGESGGAISCRTIPSDRTVPQMPAGTLSKEEVSQMVGTAHSLAKQGVKFATGQSIFHKVGPALQRLKKMFPSGGGARTATSGGGSGGVLGALKKLPSTLKALPSRLANGLRSGVKFLQTASKSQIAMKGVQGIKGAYDAVATAVAVGDIAFDMAVAFGADTNNASARGWMVFSEGFNTYATPEGLATLAVFEIIKATDDGPSLSVRAHQLKELQIYFYNQDEPAYLLNCRFIGNAAGEGGAVYSIYDNMHVEGCLFQENIAENGGAFVSSSWTTPIVISSAFYKNYAMEGHSAMANQYHSRAQIVNCTFAENYSDATNGFSLSVETGSEVKVSNCILWGNTNGLPENATGGADIFVATKESFGSDTNALEVYNASGEAYGDWIGICEIKNSCVQSLNSLPAGREEYLKFYGLRNPSTATLNAIMANFNEANENGTLESASFLNLGEGLRPGFLLPAAGNTAQDPMLIGLKPSASSPTIDAGSNKRLNNGIIRSVNNMDFLKHERLQGEKLDMGAVEFRGGAGGVVYVRANATGNNNGLSWANAKTNLQEALSMTGSEVWVAAGTYYPTNGTDRNARFSLSNGVKVYGGFSGNETELYERNLRFNTTILSGNIGSANSDSDNSFQVMLNSNVGAETLLDGFTITKGRGGSGAGIFNLNANPTIRNCKFIDNQSSGNGGGLLSQGTDGSLLEMCEFHLNTAQGGGGAVYYTSRLNAANCIFGGNTAQQGGAVAVLNTDSAKFYNCLFYSNSVAGFGSINGGAIYASQAAAGVYNSTFFANKLSANTGSVIGGGGIELAGSTLEVKNSIFWQNVALNSGGAQASVENQQIFVSSGTSSIAHNLIQGLSSFVGSSNILSDPFFVGSATGNFQLQNYSPAIDAGLNLQGQGPLVELAGKSRVANLRPDLGAYEFQGKRVDLSKELLTTVTCDHPGNIFTYKLPTNVLSGSWQVDRNDGNGFVNLILDSYHLNLHTSEMTVRNPSAFMHGFRYRFRTAAFDSDPVTLKISSQIIYVKADATGANNGITWANAYTNLQTAMAAAAPCSQIWVAAGTYKTTTSESDREASFQLLNKVEIYGGFRGDEVSVDHRDWLTNVTVLSGRISGSNFDLSGSRHVMVNDGSSPGRPINSSAVLDGFTLVGSTEGSMVNVSASPTIRNCVFIDDKRNTAIINGGNAKPSMTNCIFLKVPARLCNPDSGTSFTITSSNSVPRTYHWQIDVGGGFTTIANGGAYTITATSTGSTLAVAPVPSIARFRFTIAGINFFSPSVQPNFGSPSVAYVNASAIGSANDGSSWANAYTNLTYAISNSTECIELWVARGTYKPTSTIADQPAFTLKSGLVIYGGFYGNETQRSQRNWLTNATILSPSGTNVAVINNYGSITVPIDATAVVDGFIFQQNKGLAVVVNNNASPTIRNCLFTGNTGMSIHNRAANPTISDCTFSNNTQAIYNLESSPSISGCLFVGQTNIHQGGAIYNSDSSPNIQTSTFRNNSAGWGGAIANGQGSAPTITRCIFENNTAGNGGAIFNSFGADAVVRNSLFFKNSSPEFRGGAIAAYGDNLTVVNSTFANNVANISGAGIYFQGQSTVTILNSILWHNSVVNGFTEAGQLDVPSGSLKLTNCVVEAFSTLGGSNNIAYDPLFADPDAGDFELGGFSPAINAGRNDGVDVIDLSGGVRVSGAAIDIGAYESSGNPQGVYAIRSLPSAVATCEGNSVSFTITGALGTNYNYHWRVDNGGGFLDVNLGGIYSVTTNEVDNSSTLNISTTTFAMNNYRYRVAIDGFSLPPATLVVRKPGTIYVSGTATGANDGSDWPNAYTNFNDALTAANECSQIWVRSGTYTATNDSGPISFAMKKGVKIYGGFAGGETLLSDRNWTNNVCRLVGSSDSPLFNNLGYSTGVDGTSVLDGFTLEAFGGAMVNWQASPTIQNCIIERCHDSAIQNFSEANVTFDHCVFRFNTNGALFFHDSFPTITNCVFQTNGTLAGSPGGAIRIIDGVLTLSDSTFQANAGELGGAIYNHSATNAITRCVFEGNQAQEGGALWFIFASGEVKNSLLFDNWAEHGGGAIATDSSPVTFRNCTVTRNSTDSGGGGGLFVMRSGTITVVNSIVWKNRDRFGDSDIEHGQIYLLGGSASVSNTCVEGLSQFSGNANVKFDPLFQNAGTNNFRLTRSSPLLNAGNSAAVGGDTLDLSRVTRIFGSAVDLGSYETTQAPQTVAALLLIPESQVVCQGRDAVFTVIGFTNGGAEFTWAEKIGGVSTMINFSDSTRQIITNGNTSTLIISNVTTGMSGRSYQFMLAGQGYNSPEFLLTVVTPEIVYVNASATGDRSGTSWQNAYTNLQDALDASFACQEIWVAKGTYIPTKRTSVTGNIAFQMTPGVKLYGGFFGNELLLSERDVQAHETILLGTLFGAVVESEGTEIDRFATLDGFTITSQNGNWGMYNHRSGPTVRNCKFASNSDAALVSWRGNPLIADCVFTNNQDQAVQNVFSTVEITNCSFVGNLGGAIYNSYCTAKVSYCTFVGNTGTLGGGGAILDRQSTNVISYCTFRDNTAGVGGAVSSEEQSSTTILNSLFYENNSQHLGGAAYAGSSLLRLVHCTFTENHSVTKGAVFLNESTGIILNSILWNNTDVYSNTDTLSKQLASYGGSQTVSNSCVQGWPTPTMGNINYDPIFTNVLANDFQLDRWSPALDMGANQFATGLTVDLDGRPRQVASVDMGVYESPYTAFLNPARIVSAPTSVAVCPDENAVFRVVVETNAAGNFDWFVKDGAFWAYLDPTIGHLDGYSIIASNNVSTLVVSNVTAEMTGRLYRIGIESFEGPSVMLTVNPPSIIYVNAAAAPGGDGRSWATAFDTLQAAFSVAGSCRPEIWVAKGTYRPLADHHFIIKKDIAVYGGFAGTETLRTQRNWNLNPTILSGDLAASVRIVGFDATATTASTLDGFILEKNLRNYAISVFHGDGTIRNCTIRDNRGPGLSVIASDLTVENCFFHSNTNSGGNVKETISISQTNSSGRSVFRHCVISGNTGAGFFTHGGRTDLLNCLITGNSGHAVEAYAEGNIRIINCTIAGNRGSHVGGIFSSGPTTEIRNTILWGNRGTSGSSFYTLERQQVYTSPAAITLTANDTIEGTSNHPSSSVKSFDPLFVSPVIAADAPTTAGDFRLKTCSPVIGLGDNSYVGGVYLSPVGLISTDLDGAARIVGTIEMGAYELQSAASTPLYVLNDVPASITYCAGSVNEFSVAATNFATFEWQVDQNDGNGFISLSDNSVYSGTTSSNLVVTNATLAMNGYRYRCAIYGNSLCEVLSQPATLTVKPSRWYVDSSVPAGGTGEAWTNAFQTIQAALSNTNLVLCQSEIWVARGTGAYTGPINLPSGVALYGGFAGTEVALAERNFTNQTLLTSSTKAISAINYTWGRIDGFTITNSPQGITLVNSPTPVVNCRFIGNGQAISNHLSQARIMDCVFLQNGPANGSSIYDDSSQSSVERCLFSGNQSTSGTVYELNSASRFTNCAFSGNLATSFGAALFSAGSDTKLWNCTLAGNRANTNAPIYSMGTVTIYNSIIWGNSGAFDPGAGNVIFYSHTDPNLADPLFVEDVTAASAPTTNGNLRLSECSPFINTGHNLYIPSEIYDLDKNPRHFDYSIDFGAYEYQQTNLHVITPPVNQNGSFTIPVEFSVVPSQLTVTYQWQINRGTGFTNLLDDAYHYGSTSQTLTLTNQVQAMNNWQYRVRLQNVGGCVVDSSAATYQHTVLNIVNSFPRTNGSPWNTTIGLTLSQNAVAGSVTDETISVNAMETGRLRSTNNDIGISVVGPNITISPTANFKAGERVFVTATRNIYGLSAGIEPFVWEFRAGVNSDTNRMFDSSSQIGAGSTKRDMVAGDLDRDGFDDLVVVGDTGDFVWLNNGSGAFPSSQMLTSDGSVCVRLGDLNGDTRLDAAFVKGDGTVKIFLNSGGILSDSGMTLGADVNAVAVADVDADGSLDVIAGGASALNIFRNSGSGSFSSIQTLSAMDISTLDVGDFDRDGDIDVISLHESTNGKVWSNDSTGQFADSGQFLPVTSGTKIAVGDLNGDGFVDAIASSTNSSPVLFLNKGHGVLQGPSIDVTQPGDDLSTVWLAHVLAPVENAFDNNPLTTFRSAFGFNEVRVRPAMSPTVINALRLTGAQDSPHDDPGWISVDGSHDGVNYTRLLHTQILFSTPRGVVRTLPFANSTAYSHYSVVFHTTAGNGTGVQTAEIELLSKAAPALSSQLTGNFTLGDINGDGQLDLCVTRTNGLFEVWRNDGAANFTSAFVAETAADGQMLTADFDNDGDLDLLQDNGGTGGATVSLLQSIDLSTQENTATNFISSKFSTRFANAGLGTLTEVRILSLPSEGSLTFNLSPVSLNQQIPVDDLTNLVYTPGLNLFGMDSFTWQGANSGGYEASVFTAHIFVRNLQSPPVVGSDSIIVGQYGTATTLVGGADSVLDNDSDPDFDSFFATIYQQPTHGSLTLNFDGTFSYTQNGTEPAVDSFIYRATDAYGNFSPMTVTITVTNVNDAAEDILVSSNRVMEGLPSGAVVGEFSANDPDAGDSNTFSLVSGTGDTDNDSFAINGGFLETATTLNFNTKSTHSIRVRATDVAGATYEKVFTILTATAPDAFNQTVGVDEDAAVWISLVGSDRDGDGVGFAIVDPPQFGSFSTTPPTLHYSPNPNFTGQDTFTFEVNDGAHTSTVATVTINVAPLNDRPVANAQSVSTPEDSPGTFVLTGSDVDLDTLTYHLDVLPIHGSAVLAGDTVTYTPATNYFGSDTFSFYVGDGTTNSTSKTVSINVTPTDDAPIALSASFTTSEDTFIPTFLTANNPDGDGLIYTVVTQPTNGFLAGGNQFLIYHPNPNFHGTDTFTFTASDGVNSSITNGTISITVTPVNDPPVAISHNMVAAMETENPMVLQATDVDGDDLTFTILESPNGLLSGTAPDLVYTPASEFFGNTRLRFEVSDGHGGVDSSGVVNFHVMILNMNVSSTADSGPGTLRNAFDVIRNNIASTPWTITFSPSLAGETIGLFSIGDTNMGNSAFGTTNKVIIAGDTAPGIIIQRVPAAPPMRLFYAGPGADLTIRDIVLQDGWAQGGNGIEGGNGGGGGGAGMGGAIFSAGSLRLTNVVFANHQANGGNGGDFGAEPFPGSGNGGGPNGGLGYGHSGNPTNPPTSGGFGGGGGGNLTQIMGRVNPGGFGGGDSGGGSPHTGSFGGTSLFGGGGGAGNGGAGGGGLGAGAAIFNRGGTVFAEDCLFTNNIVTGGLGGDGFISLFDGKAGRALGAGIFNFNGTVRLYNSEFWDNNAGEGHAVFALGDGTNSVVDLEQVLMSNPAGTNLAVATLNGGTADIVPRDLAGTVQGRGAKLTIDVVPENSLMTITGVSQGAAGLVTFTSTNLTYDHDASGTLADSFSAEVTGPHGGVSYLQVDVTINDVNLPPEANDDFIAIFRGETVVIPVLTNDFDLNEDEITVVSLPAFPAEGHIAQMTPTNITYVHNSLSTATSDSFQYRISDGSTNRDTATVHITISAPIITVTNADDSGPGSLRAAITRANEATFFYPYEQVYRIHFAPSLAGTNIVISTVGDSDPLLGDSAFFVTNSIIIDASDAPGLTISRDTNGASMRLFRVIDPGNLSVVNLTLADGLAIGSTGDGLGGAVYNDGGYFQMTNATIRNCEARGSSSGGRGAGGAVYNSGEFVMAFFQAENSLLLSNVVIGGTGTETEAFGGAIYNFNGILNLTGLTISNNVAAHGGGVYQVADGMFTACNLYSSVVNNPLGGTNVVSISLNFGLSIIYSRDSFILSETAPSLSDMPNRTIRGDESFDFTVVPPADDSATTVNLYSGDEGVLPNTALLVTGTGTTRTAFIDTTPGVYGTITIYPEILDNGLSRGTEFVLTIAPPLPVAQNDSTTVDQDTSTNIDVLSNDSTAEGTITLTSFNTNATIGIVSDNLDGTFSYDPAGRFDHLQIGEDASDSFTYTITNTYGDTATGTVNITITGLNDVPVAGTDSFSVRQTQTVNVSLAKLLVNDGDVDGDTLTVTAVSLSTNGVTVVLNPTAISYTPNGDFVGEDRFTYTVSEGHGETALGTVVVTVRPTDPVSQSQTALTVTPTSRIIRYAGIPGQKYIVQAAGFVSGPWGNLSGTLTAGATGIIEFEDAESPPPAMRFYRIVLAP